MAGSKTILFVEDDRPISEMYARLLTKSGYHVDFAYDGNEAITKLSENVYDLVLLDIMMPGKNGIDVLHDIRADARHNISKVVILTNLAQDKTSKAALKAEADGYLVKADLIPSQLAEVVKSIVG